MAAEFGVRLYLWPWSPGQEIPVSFMDILVDGDSVVYKANVSLKNVFAEHIAECTYCPTGTRNSFRFQGLAWPAHTHLHLLVCFIRPANFALGGLDVVARQLFIGFGLDIPAMILIEIANLVHKVDGSVHILFYIDFHAAELTHIAIAFVERWIILELVLLDRIHDHKEGDWNR